jgi:hypothetical protein
VEKREKPVRDQSSPEKDTGEVKEGEPEYLGLPEIKTVLLKDIFTD